MAWWQDWLFPPQCLHCGKDTARQGQWCESCFKELYQCRLVGDVNSPYIDKLWVLSQYKGGIKTLLHDVKFNQKQGLAVYARPFLDYFIKEGQVIICDYVIPVPVSEAKRKTRGYNQVDVFYKSWVHDLSKKRGHWQWLDCLAKANDTATMWQLGRKDRRKNMSSAFYVKAQYRHSSLLKGATVLVVDDVFTTGATLDAVAHVLSVYEPRVLLGLCLTSAMS